MPAFTDYQNYRTRFAVERDRVRRSIAACEPLVLEALAAHARRHLWRGELPVYVVMTTPADNGGWGHLMPVWFKPHERPIPFHALDNWALFALVFAGSFGSSAEAKALVDRVFTVENLVRVVVGTNLQFPFLPGTQGRGRFFRHGMLPFLLSVLWLDEDARRSWLRLCELGAQRFIDAHHLAAREDPVEVLTGLEYAIFARLERNSVTDDAAVAAFLAGTGGQPSLLGLYRDLFGAINLGITALAAYYRGRPLENWRDWVQRELAMPYRLHDYGIEAVNGWLKRSGAGRPMKAD